MRNALIPRTEIWDPFNLVRGLHEEMDRVFERSLVPSRIWKKGERFFAPDVDVKDENDRLVVKADIPGIKKEDLSITVNGDLLTVEGERKEEQEKKEKDFYYAERFYGSFSRTVELPARVRTEGVKASYKDGVLELTLPKEEGAKSKEVKVQIQ